MAPSWLAPILGTLHPLLGVAGSSLVQQKDAMTWYDKIKKPSWTPPNYLFPPVWTIIGTFHPLVGGFGASFAGKENLKWYDAQVKKPWWTPPNYVFGPVWAGLYASMG
ncbi:hypothetical protein Bbelb_332870 [Branchiostoma belcheri]|nr:hypothetical protein Bbelb_332870 [Branchiostoma belcheri]